MATARSSSIPSPVGGLNDRNSIADMPETDALILDNWWPLPSVLQVRKGSQNHVTGFAAPVETLVEYLPPSGVSKLFAASGTSFYDVTTAGAVGAAVQTGLTNALWQHANITTPGGSFLYMVNGVDDPRLFNGTTWTAITGSSTPAITGVDPKLFAQVCLFKNRLYFAETNALKVWYLPVQSVGGAASELDFGSIFSMGGRVEACFTWTIDAGSGSDDHFVVITNQGEVAVYEGTDPSTSTTWRLVGVFRLGRPLGRRCGAKFGGDLVINTVEGVFPLGRALLSSTINRSVALSDKIQNSVSTAAATYGNNTGWDVVLYPDANMLLVNIPAGQGQNFQYVQNTITGAWTKFVGWNAYDLLNASSGLYYAGQNAVVKAWVGNADNGLPIQADCAPAFSYFKNPGRNKFFTLVRVNIATTGQPSITYGLNTDFTIRDTSGSLNVIPPTGMVWGSMVWGSMVWGGELRQLAAWNTVGDLANSASIRVKVLNNSSQVQMTNIDYLHQLGGIL
jgi:hypothetical protein